VVDLDWTEGDPEVAKPGLYLAEVFIAEDKISKGGDSYINVQLKNTATSKLLCYDILMLQGNGARIGYGKLSVLGVERGTTTLNVAELVGRRMWVATTLEEYMGTERLIVDIQAESSTMGYWPEDAPPKGAPSVTPAAAPEDTPF